MNKPKIYNRYRRLNNLYKIIDKDGKSVVFSLNKSQELVYDLEKKYKRFIILKARQLGMSTLKLISWLDEVIRYSNRTITITAHKKEKQQELFQKVKYAFNEIPNRIKLSDWTLRTKPTPKYDSVNELYFPHNNSRIKVSLDSRSWTVTNLHITELAFRDDARVMMTWTLPSVPKDAKVTIETTANWVGNYFYEFRNKFYNKTKLLEQDFYPVFIPRHTDEDYRIWLEESETISLPDKLKHLETLPIDKEQIKRYLQQYELLGKEVFQEYPSTPDEAFLTTGDTVWDQMLIKKLPVLKYSIDPKYRALRIYWEPQTCIMGIDLAEWWESWDFSSISVRTLDGKLLAFYYEHAPHDYIAEVVDYLVELWYVGVIWPEANAGWVAFINKARDYWWSRYMYTRTTIDSKSQKQTKKYWWYTNQQTRELAVREYEEAVRTGVVNEVDERLRSEMFSFVYNEKKKAEAIEWSHDDAIMSDAICWQMRKEKVPVVFK